MANYLSKSENAAQQWPGDTEFDLLHDKLLYFWIPKMVVPENGPESHSASYTPVGLLNTRTMLDMRFPLQAL